MGYWRATGMSIWFLSGTVWLIGLLEHLAEISVLGMLRLTHWAYLWHSPRSNFTMPKLLFPIMRLNILSILPTSFSVTPMGLLPDTYNCGLRMRRECRERFPRHRNQRKPLVIDPGMHHDTCVTHVPWCMSGSITRGGGENVPGIPGACATRNFTYLVRGPWHRDNHTIF